MLEPFLPQCDAAERHQVRVAAPAGKVFALAQAADFDRSALIRGIFRARELLMGAGGPRRDLPHGLVDRMKALGWGVLSETPGREMVFGAVTQPWLADVVFRALPPDQFASFHQPGFVKIAWTLRVDPLDRGQSLVRTETRAAATDEASRRRFRRYWMWVSPGVRLIRRLILRMLKREAEREQKPAGI